MKINNMTSSLDSLSEIIWSRIPSYIFQIALELKLFEYIGEEPKVLEEIARFSKLPVSSTRIFLQYLCSQNLLKFEGQCFSLTAISYALLHDQEIIYDLGVAFLGVSELEALLKYPNKQQWYEIKEQGKNVLDFEDVNEGFFLSERRHQWRIEKGMELASIYNFSKHKTLLDIGGASGGWCIGVKEVYPDLSCSVYDLPDVCKFTRIMFDKNNTHQIGVIEGDLFNNPLVGGADVVLLANVLHDWSEQDGLVILKKVYDFLPKNGVVLVYEFFLNDQWQGPPASLHHALSVLGPDGQSGWQPSYVEMEKMLESCGFICEKRKPNLVLGVKR